MPRRTVSGIEVPDLPQHVTLLVRFRRDTRDWCFELDATEAQAKAAKERLVVDKAGALEVHWQDYFDQDLKWKKLETSTHSVWLNSAEVLYARLVTDQYPPGTIPGRSASSEIPAPEDADCTAVFVDGTVLNFDFGMSVDVDIQLSQIESYMRLKSDGFVEFIDEDGEPLYIALANTRLLAYRMIDLDPPANE